MYASLGSLCESVNYLTVTKKIVVMKRVGSFLWARLICKLLSRETFLLITTWKRLRCLRRKNVNLPSPLPMHPRLLNSAGLSSTPEVLVLFFW